MTPIEQLPGRTAIRLDPATREAVTTIAKAIAHPHRKPVTLTDVVKAALQHAAAAVKATGALQAV